MYRDYIESTGNPQLSNGDPPRTDLASMSTATREDFGGEGTHAKRSQKNRMTSLEVSEVIEANLIKTGTQLLALAQEQKVEGKCDLAEFIMNR